MSKSHYGDIGSQPKGDICSERVKLSLTMTGFHMSQCLLKFKTCRFPLKGFVRIAKYKAILMSDTGLKFQAMLSPAWSMISKEVKLMT